MVRSCRACYLDFKRVGVLMEENNTEVIDYTELLGQILAEEQAQVETIAEIKQVQEDSLVQLQTLNGSLLTIVAFLVLNFCWSCMRQWRKNILKMGV